MTKLPQTNANFLSNRKILDSTGTSKFNTVSSITLEGVVMEILMPSSSDKNFDRQICKKYYWRKVGVVFEIMSGRACEFWLLSKI